LSTSAIALCMAMGTFAAFIASLCGASFEWQLIVLAAATVATLPVFPRLIKRYRLHLSDGNESSNMEALIGRKATVWQGQSGPVAARVKIDGDNWQAVSTDGRPLSTGEEIEVVDYDSIILKVRHCREQN
ncbi:MAG: NfeD family protein, partial [Paramuribaculum sp.]|nr:NfeD family protein [Paramuribaculum sp.]